MDPKIRITPPRERRFESDGKRAGDCEPASVCAESSALRVCILVPDRSELQTLSRAFTAMGCEVLALDQVIGASNRIRPFRPDVLVVDVNMPSISGAKLLQVLRRNLITMPALVLYSDMDEDELAEIARVAATHDFVVKKQGLGALAASVRRLGERTKRDKKITTI